MGYFKKIVEIRAYPNNSTKQFIEMLENKGFIVVDDDESDSGWKTYHVLRNEG